MVFIYIDTVKDPSSNKTLGYTLKDQQGNIRVLKAAEIKSLLHSGNMVRGIKIGIDSRLVISHSAKRNLAPNIDSLASRVIIETGETLLKSRKSVVSGKEHERDFVADLNKFMLDKNQSRSVCVVAGIRRTGKTVGLSQCALDIIQSGIPSNKIAFISIVNTTESITSSELIPILDHLTANGTEYIFIDEVTAITGFLALAKRISDYTGLKSKIILTGTDSYAFPLALQDSLFGRAVYLNTSSMLFSEYEKVMLRDRNLTSTAKILEFIKYGGVLSRDDYSTLDFAFIALKNAILGNIINTIRRNIGYSSIGDTFGIENLSDEKLGYLILSIFTSVVRPSSSEYVGNVKISTSDIALRMFGEAIGADTIEPTRLAQGIRTEHRDFVLRALKEMHVIATIQNHATESKYRSSGDVPKYETICLVPSIVYILKTSIAKSIYTGSIDKFGAIIGDCLENMILSQCIMFSNFESTDNINYNISFIRYTLNDLGLKHYRESNRTPEIDIAINVSGRCSDTLESASFSRWYLLEVKNSSSIKSAKSKNLNLKSLELNGSITKYIIYNGETARAGDIQYINIYDFLTSMKNWIK